MTLTIAPHPLPLRVDPDGTVRVGNTRVLLELIIEGYSMGETAEEIALDFDTLDLADVYAVISYYLRNRREVDTYIEQCRREAETLRHDVEARYRPGGTRERLLARRHRHSAAQD